MVSDRVGWERPGVAKAIDAYWQANDQIAFRQKIVHDLVGRLAPGSVLDAGCGSGLLYGMLRNAGLLASRPYLGIDSSAAMLKIARRRYLGITFLSADITVLAKDSRADNVLCVQVLQHLPDYKPAVQALMQAARKLLYIVTWFSSDGDVVRIDPATGFYDNYWDQAAMLYYIQKQRPVRQVDIVVLDGPAQALAVQL